MAYILQLVRKECLVLALWVIILGGCAMQPLPEEQITEVATSLGQPMDLAWLDQGLIVEYEARTNEGLVYQIARLDPETEDMQMLPLPDKTDCERSDFRRPTSLPDGRLGYIVYCTNNYISQLYMMTYDFSSNQVKPLLGYPFKGGIGQYSWNPAMTRGIAGDGGTLVGKLFWFTPTLSETLDQSFPQARAPAWSPDGQKIAFIAAPEQGIPRGIGRADSLYNLYLMDADGTNVRPLVEGFLYPVGLSWSPDGQWLAFNATFEDSYPKEGLWLVQVASEKRRLVMAGTFGASAWSPDGKRLAAIQITGDFPAWEYTLIIAEMSSLLER